MSIFDNYFKEVRGYHGPYNIYDGRVDKNYKYYSAIYVEKNTGIVLKVRISESVYNNMDIADAEATMVVNVYSPIEALYGRRHEDWFTSYVQNHYHGSRNNIGSLLYAKNNLLSYMFSGTGDCQSNTPRHIKKLMDLLHDCIFDEMTGENVGNFDLNRKLSEVYRNE